ncbi:hypothetical protein [Nocardia xishanensis]
MARIKTLLLQAILENLQFRENESPLFWSDINTHGAIPARSAVGSVNPWPEDR